MRIFFVLLLITGSQLFSTPVISPHDEEILLLNKADDRLQNLNEKIKRFLDERGVNLKKNEADLRETGEWKQAVKDDAAFREDFKKLQKRFQDFQDSLVQVVVGNYGRCPYSRTLRCATIYELAEWYSNYIEEVVFQGSLDKDDDQPTNPPAE